MERCDRCGVQARYRATCDGKELFLCGHDGRVQELALVEQSWTITELQDR